MTRDEFERDLFDAARLDCMSTARAEIIRDQVRALLAATRAEALRLAMAECEAEAALCDSEKSGLDAGSAARNCRDRIADLVRR